MRALVFLNLYGFPCNVTIFTRGCSMDKFDIVNRAGQGAYGVVLRARIKQTGKTVAIKKMNVTTRDRLPILRELCALRNMNHPKILTLIDVFCSRDTLSLVTEFVPYHLNDVIIDQRRPRDESFIRYASLGHYI
uniref:Protein kinase domain-containing protein n=1 Tax=Heterorhabditis bacteriophora TaxID=37862 RepID=A0A1I7XAD1_HETBA